MKKIILIGYMPLTEKVEKDFFLSGLMENKVEVEYWDLSGIYFWNVEFRQEISRTFVHKISDYKFLEEAIKRSNDHGTGYAINITFELKVIKLFRMLAANGCRTIFFARGYIPCYREEGKSFIGKLFSITGIRNIRSLPLRVSGFVLARLLLPFYRKTGLVRDYDAVFAAGKAAANAYKGMNVIKINYFDYDEYLKQRSVGPLNGEKYILFLDENLPDHPDFAMFGRDMVEAANYYSSMNRYFKLLEQKYSMPVVIAAHPKADYSKNNPFDGRKIFYGQTCALSRDCALAIVHMSTSVSFPVLYSKPILFPVTKCMKSIDSGRIEKNVRAFASELDCEIIDVERIKNVNDITDLPPVHLKAYEEYKYKYLTSEQTKDTISENIVIKHLKEL